jgi:hypothetical protein
MKDSEDWFKSEVDTHEQMALNQSESAGGHAPNSTKDPAIVSCSLPTPNHRVHTPGRSKEQRKNRELL